MWSGALIMFALLAATAPAFGQVWSRVTWPDSGWSQIASSADGTKLVAAALYSGETLNLLSPLPLGVILLSTNSGRTWTKSSAPEAYWLAVACSTNGSTIIAASTLTLEGLPGPIYTSTNSGSTWTEFVNWTTNFASIGPLFGEVSAVACSADGNLLVVAAGPDDGPILTSKNGGPWTVTSAPDELWTSVAVSADGSKLLAANEQLGPDFPYFPDPFWVSTNSGGTWAPTTTPSGFTEIASSADGSLSVAAIYETNQPGGIYISTNNWASSTITGATGTNGDWWVALASLAEGGQLLAFSIDGGIYLTMGTGSAWTLVPSPNENWYSVACSADGTKLAAVVSPYYGNIYAPQSSAFGIYTWPSTPTLTLSPLTSTNALLLSWAATIPSLGLQQISDLTQTNWTSLTNAAATTNGLIQAAAPVSGGSMFFRLGRK
jgi:hypothetical protein